MKLTKTSVDDSKETAKQVAKERSGDEEKDSIEQDDFISNEGTTEATEVVAEVVIEKCKVCKEVGEEASEDSIVDEASVEVVVTSDVTEIGDDEIKVDDEEIEEKEDDEEIEVKVVKVIKKCQIKICVVVFVQCKHLDTHTVCVVVWQQIEKKKSFFEAQSVCVAKRSDAPGCYDFEVVVPHVKKYHGDEDTLCEPKVTLAINFIVGGPSTFETHSDETTETSHVKIATPESGVCKAFTVNGNSNTFKTILGVCVMRGGEVCKTGKIQFIHGNTKSLVKCSEVTAFQICESSTSINHSVDVSPVNDSICCTESGSDPGVTPGIGGEPQFSGTIVNKDAQIANVVSSNDINSVLVEGKSIVDPFARSALIATSKNADDSVSGRMPNLTTEGHSKNTKMIIGDHTHCEETNVGKSSGPFHKASNQTVIENKKMSTTPGNRVDSSAGEQSGSEIHIISDGLRMDEEGNQYNVPEENSVVICVSTHADTVVCYVESPTAAKNVSTAQDDG